MIITAKVANAQSNKTLECPRKWCETFSLTRKLKRIERAINRKSKKGQTSVSYYGVLPDTIWEVLIRNGYNVIDRSNYDCEWIVIDWSKPN